MTRTRGIMITTITMTVTIMITNMNTAMITGMPMNTLLARLCRHRWRNTRRTRSGA